MRDFIKKYIEKPCKFTNIPKSRWAQISRKIHILLPARRFIVRTSHWPVDRPIGRLSSNGPHAYRTGPDVHKIASDICQRVTSGLCHASPPQRIEAPSDISASVWKAVRYHIAYSFRSPLTRPASVTASVIAASAPSSAIAPPVRHLTVPVDHS